MFLLTASLPVVAFFIAAALAQPSPSNFNSRNVSDAIWACSDLTTSTGIRSSSGSISANLFFPNGSIWPVCGTEVLQGQASVMPTIYFFNETAPTSQLFTVIAVDRDAPNRITGAPRRHGIFVSIPQAVMEQGLSPDNLFTVGGGIRVIANYSGPRPGAGSGCHRYYVRDVI